MLVGTNGCLMLVLMPRAMLMSGATSYMPAARYLVSSCRLQMPAASCQLPGASG